MVFGVIYLWECIVMASCQWCLLDVCVCVVVLSSLVSVRLFAGRWWLVLCHLCGLGQSSWLLCALLVAYVSLRSSFDA